MQLSLTPQRCVSAHAPPSRSVLDEKPRRAIATNSADIQSLSYIGAATESTLSSLVAVAIGTSTHPRQESHAGLYWGLPNPLTPGQSTSRRGSFDLAHELLRAQFSAATPGNLGVATQFCRYLTNAKPGICCGKKLKDLVLELSPLLRKQIVGVSHAP